MCRPGSLIGFKLITQRSGPNRQGQASKTNAKPQEIQRAAAKQMARDKLSFSPLVLYIPITSIKAQCGEKKKERKGKVIMRVAAPEQLGQRQKSL